MRLASTSPVTVTPVLIDQLLDQLANNDTFRSDMLADPVSALRGLGISADPKQIPAHRSLPSKQVLLANRDLIKSKLSGTEDLLYFFLDGKG
jgi:putative modified peptide